MEQGAHSETRRPRRVRRGLFGAAGLAVAAAVVAVLAGWLPGGDDSAQHALAAASKELASDQILHVRATQVQINPPSSPLGRRVDGTVDQWVDGRTGGSHLRLDFPSLDHNPEIDDETGHLEAWFDGDRTTWTIQHAAEGSKEPSPLQVAKTVSPSARKVDSDGSLLDGLRRVLERAGRGEATIADGGTWHRVPVAKVTTREEQTTTTMWIARTEPLRLLKQVTLDRVPDGTVRVTTTVDVWQLFPASDAAAQRNVAVPDFDPAKYDVQEPFATTP